MVLVDKFTKPPFYEPKPLSQDKELVPHAKMYTLEENHRIANLKNYAVEEFARKLQNCMFSVGFFEAFEVAFSSTPDGGTKTRSTVVKVLDQELKETGMISRLKEKVLEVPELSVIPLHNRTVQLKTRYRRKR